MSDELWETIDWGDDDDNDTIDQEDHSFTSSTIDTKETAGTIRLSGASTASESVDTPSLSTTSRRKVVELQQTQREDKRASWFDFEDELEDEQAFLNHSARSQRVKTDSPTRNATSRSLRAVAVGTFCGNPVGMSDYTIEKNRASERRSATKKSSEEREERPTCHPFTWKLQQMNSALQRSVGLAKKAEVSPAPNDEGLDVPFPLNARCRRLQ